MQSLSLQGSCGDTAGCTSSEAPSLGLLELGGNLQIQQKLHKVRSRTGGKGGEKKRVA